MRYRVCEAGAKVVVPEPIAEAKSKTKSPASKSGWLNRFFDKKGPSLRKAIGVSDATS